ncbi:hypothetical protein [Methylotenera sp.]|uniref:hypothetical protein n=1 Tax=Methylotenera sp. TaxID=2051956 RepID=UPI00271EB548|nr:hypothetical protein [Methylotenera sp.]MDO9206065.1 hypothetical protein [Methylotenera sp.]
MFTITQNQCSRSSIMGVHDAPEYAVTYPKIGHDKPFWLVTIDRNHWSRWTVLTGHDRP